MHFDDYERRGDYLVPRDTLEEAEREFAQRSTRSRATDLAMRGTITTDYASWKAVDGRGVDYPGVDTPSAEPRFSAIDHLGPGTRGRLGSGEAALRGEALLVEDPASRRRPASVTDTIGRAANSVWEASGVVANVLRPGSVPWTTEPREEPDPR